MLTFFILYLFSIFLSILFIYFCSLYSHTILPSYCFEKDKKSWGEYPPTFFFSILHRSRFACQFSGLLNVKHETETDEPMGALRSRTVAVTTGSHVHRTVVVSTPTADNRVTTCSYFDFSILYFENKLLYFQKYSY